MMESKQLELTGAPVEFIRSADGKTRISGYAVIYSDGTPQTEFRDGKIRERVKPGAFAEYVRSGQPIAIVFNHDKNLEIGRSDYPDTTVREDAKGVYVEVDYDDTDPTHQLVKAKKHKPGSRLGWSFHAHGSDTLTKENGEYYRTIHTIEKVTDLSIVMRPAYGATKVFVRSEDEAAEIAKLERKIAISEDAKNQMAKTR